MQSLDRVLSLLSHCSNLRTLKRAHGFMVPRGLDLDNLVLGKFIDASSTLGLVSYARSVFDHHPYPNTYVFNTMIRALYLSNDSVAQSEAVLFFNHLRALRLIPDAYTFPFLLKAVVRLSKITAGLQIHSQTISCGLAADSHVVTALVQMYASCGYVSDARKAFDEMPVRDSALWNAMIVAYAKANDLDEARALFDQMPPCKRNVVSWTSVISGCVQTDRPSEAVSMFRKMHMESGCKPDEVTVLTVISACSRLGALELGEWIHRYASNRGLNDKVALNNALIDMYAKSGEVEKALKVFEKMSSRNVVTWTTMIVGLAMHGRGREALEMFSRMEDSGVKPNDVTFVGILTACCHVGLVELGRRYFDTMRTEYGIEPNIKHYGCMIDLLGRAGLLGEAQELIQKMPFEANEAIWGSLLAASKLHRDLELAERALRHLIQLEPWNSGNYALLSNICSELGKWDESRALRKRMRDAGVKKAAGSSSIEVGDRIQQFTAGETSHPHLDKIHEILQTMDLQLKKTEDYREEHDGCTTLSTPIYVD